MLSASTLPVESPAIRVLLADDHQLVRESLAGLLRQQRDLDLVGEASDGLAAVALAQELKPDVVLMDIGMPKLGGVDATERILADNPKAKVIGLSAHHEPRLVAAMIGAGASGYVLKDSAFRDLVQALRVTMDDKSYLSPGVAGVVVAGFRSNQTGSAGAFAKLSVREREVAELLAQGLSTKQVAAKLGVSPKTVGTHREHIMSKLQIRSIAELTKKALLDGLI